MEQEREHTISIETLSEQTGISVRNIRFYIAEGLLTGPGTRGKSASYTDEHLLRLRMIHLLTEQRVPLMEIRQLMEHLSPEEVRGLLEKEGLSPVEPAGEVKPISPKEYLEMLLAGARAAQQRRAASAPTRPAVAPGESSPASTPPGLLPNTYPRRPNEPGDQAWQRLELAPGVELHVQVSAREPNRQLIERIISAAREEP